MRLVVKNRGKERRKTKELDRETKVAEERRRAREEGMNYVDFAGVKCDIRFGLYL